MPCGRRLPCPSAVCRIEPRGDRVRRHRPVLAASARTSMTSPTATASTTAWAHSPHGYEPDRQRTADLARTPRAARTDPRRPLLDPSAVDETLRCESPVQLDARASPKSRQPGLALAGLQVASVVCVCGKPGGALEHEGGLKNARRAVPSTDESRWVVTPVAMKVAVVGTTGSPATRRYYGRPRGRVRRTGDRYAPSRVATLVQRRM